MSMGDVDVHNTANAVSVKSRLQQRYEYVNELLLAKDYTLKEIIFETVKLFPEWWNDKKQVGRVDMQIFKILRDEVIRTKRSLRIQGKDAEFIHMKGVKVVSHRPENKPRHIMEWFRTPGNPQKLSWKEKEEITQYLL